MSSTDEKRTASSSIPQITYTTPKQVPRATSLQEFLEWTSTKKEPIVYKIQEDEKPAAFDKWDEDFFASSDKKVCVHQCTSERFFDIVNSSILELAISAMKHHSTMGEFVQNLQHHRHRSATAIGSQLLSGTDLYLRQDYHDKPQFDSLLRHDLGDKMKQLIPVPYDDIRIIGLWISGGGTSSQTHFDRDGDDNMNFQIRGRKLFTLYEPTDGRKHLYPLPGRLANIAMVDPYRPNEVTRFPLLQHAQPHVVEVQEGDVLFLPALWWHDVRHIGDWNVNITAWFRSGGGRGPVRDPNDGPWFCCGATFVDTFMAWFYLGKLLVVLLVVAILKLLQHAKMIIDPNFHQAIHSALSTGKKKKKTL